jgi:uncharacterized protein (TIGR03084 family)
VSSPGAGVGDLLADLAAEQRALQTVLGALDADGWLRPTPARGWDVRDSVAHLADTDDMVIATATGRPGSLADRAAASASGEDVTFAGVLRGRKGSGRDALAWWESSCAAMHDMFVALDPNARVPWGIGMRPPSLVTARLMETWAHGLDVRSAVRADANDTDRLAHVAWLATRALPYAYSVAGREPPPDPIRVELTLPSGAPWTYGPEDAVNRITGPADEYCRVFVNRATPERSPNLRAEGDAAVDALRVSRAYL